MKVGFGSVVVTAGVNGILSFCFLALAIGTEYWYIIDDSRTNLTEPEHVHSGFWGVSDDVQPFSEAPPDLSESAKHMQNMHNVIAILLPLSLVMLVFGGICGLVSSLARSRALLMGTASYFLLCNIANPVSYHHHCKEIRVGLLTLSGVSLYISYSQQALEETEKRMGPEQMALVHTSFGWSMGMAWLSFILEVITGLLLLLAARMAQLTQYQETVAPI